MTSQRPLRGLGATLWTAAMAVAIAAGATAAGAADLSLRCDMPKARAKYGHSKVYFVGWKEGSDTVVLADEWSLEFMKGPVQAKVKINNANRLTFKWAIEGIDGVNAANVERLRFTGTYLKKTGRLDVQVRLSGYDPYPGVRGGCRTVPVSTFKSLK